jgi:hypothetical protein
MIKPEAEVAASAMDRMGRMLNMICTMCVERAYELEKLSNTRERLGEYVATTVCRIRAVCHSEPTQIQIRTSAQRQEGGKQARWEETKKANGESLYIGPSSGFSATPHDPICLAPALFHASPCGT